MKTIKKQLKRAFTIVELVIVIAVVAALAAILIPTFVNVVNAANVSADSQMLANINKAIVAEDILSDVNTPSQALEVAAEMGYSIDKLTPTSDGNYIVYDQNTKSFALLDSEGNTVYSLNDATIDADSPSTWWLVTSTADMTSSTRSYILTGDIASQSQSSVNAKTTLSGKRTAASKTSSSVSISGTTLTYTGFGGLNAYNVSSTITEVVYKLDDSSAGEYKDYYNENNNFVINIEIKAAKISIDTGSYSGTFVIDSYGAKDTVVKVTSTSATVSVNDYSGAYYVENTSITFTSTVNTVSESVYENVINDTGVLELGNEEYPYLIKSESDFYNINNYETSMKEGNSYYFKQTADLTITGSEKFIANTSSEYVAGYGYYDYAVVSYLRGEYNGDGYSINVKGENVNDMYLSLFGTLNNATIKKIKLYIGTSSKYVSNTLSYTTFGETTFEKIDIYNYGTESALTTNDRNYGLLVSFPTSTVVIDTCNNYADIYGTGWSAVWIGSVQELTKLNVVDSHNYGYISGDYVFLYWANFNNSKITSDNITIENSSNEGTIIATRYAALFGYASSDPTTNATVNKCNTTFASTAGNGTLAICAALDLATIGDSNVINVTNSTTYNTYKLVYNTTATYKGNGNGGGFVFSIEFDPSEDIVYDALLIDVASAKEQGVTYDTTKSYTSGSTTYYIGTLGSTTYIVIDNSDFTINSSNTSIMLQVYTSDTLVGYQKIR